MLFTLKEKKKYVLNISNKLNKCLSLLIINFNKIKANDINYLRKKIYKKYSFFYIVRNNLLRIVLNKIKLNFLIKFFKGSILIFGSEKYYSYPSMIFEKYFTLYNKKFILKSICINKKLVSYDIHKKISLFYNKKRSFKYLFYYLKNISIIKFLSILLIIKNKKS